MNRGNSSSHPPNYISPATRTVELLSIDITLIAVAVLMVILRLTSRFLVSKNPGWDDYMIMVAMILGFIQTVLSLCCIPMETSKNLWLIHPQEHLAYTLKMLFTVEIVYLLAVTAIKTSILCLYLRISPSKSFRKVVLAHMVLAVSGGLIATLATILQCMPVAKTWNGALHGKCFDRGILLEAVVVFNLATNTMILLLPMPMIIGLHMPWRRKLMVLSIFSIGIIPCASLIARLILWSHKIPASSLQKNSTWLMVSAQDWAIVEVCSGLFCASLVHLKPLFTILKSRLLQTSQAVLCKARSSRSRAPGPVGKDMTMLNHNNPNCKATLIKHARSSEYAVEGHEGMIMNNDVFTTETCPNTLCTPDKVLILSAQNSWETESSMVSPSSYV